MSNTESSMSSLHILNEIDKIFKEGLAKLQNACNLHIPFGISLRNGKEGNIKYIPERCFTTYISWALINSGFNVFNEQEVDFIDKGKRSQHFDIIARRITVNCRSNIQLKIEAKGNLDSGYKTILNDIKRMEYYTLTLPDYNLVGLNHNLTDESFPNKYNCIVTSNWGLPSLSNWWIDDSFNIPENRHAAEWNELKEKLLHAEKRGKFTILESRNDWKIDALYAIFSCKT